jgi:aryl sulfotransferase
LPTLSRSPLRHDRTFAYDSHRWDGYEPRGDDIVIATYPKCGTTWTQRIVDMLVFQSAEPREVTRISPWLDSRLFTTVEEDLSLLAAQNHRRSIKSHMPLDLLPVYEEVKYIHVARDGRDACMSFHNHQMAINPAAIAQRIAILMQEGIDGPPPAPPPADLHDYYLQWIKDAEEDDLNRSYFAFERTYWSERRRPNLLMVHYNDLKSDLAGEMRRISDFLAIDTPPALLAELASAAEFEAMKRQGDQLMPGVSDLFEGGSQRFLHKGTNGRWREVLTDEDVARFETALHRALSPNCAAWVQTGRLAAGDPREAAD